MNRASSRWPGDRPHRGEDLFETAAHLAGGLEAVLRRPRARALRTTASISGLTEAVSSLGGWTRHSRTASSTSISLSPTNRRRPVSISNSRAPTAKMSERPSTCLPHACSGDMYWSLPLRAPIWVWLDFETALTIPKSHSLIVPS